MIHRLMTESADLTTKRDFEAFIRMLKESLRDRLANEWPAFRAALFQIGDGVVDRTRSDMARWTGLLSTGALSRDDFEWLAEGPGDWRKPWSDWISTRYEQKALREGRTPHYLTFRRI